MKYEIHLLTLPYKTTLTIQELGGDAVINIMPPCFIVGRVRNLLINFTKHTDRHYKLKRLSPQCLSIGMPGECRRMPPHWDGTANT